MGEVMWSLGVLKVRPAPQFMAAAMAVSARQLSGASCPELTALLVGAARMRYLPPGRWLLELFDQLYWTADQLTLLQLANVNWSLGRLQLVAVPQELLERLLA
ncbi:hypothetical protein OEZ85_000309 [Tetradesmus obliquus]|uniref:Uncharacterized protein n=1 Tax=Tetradesmus obliquus TaxID=3088 RepID=A0ABY8UVP2_TETOB|nr:hypothetical protein OEZ85_000309 [Tetradesmus obliquus]